MDVWFLLVAGCAYSFVEFVHVECGMGYSLSGSRVDCMCGYSLHLYYICGFVCLFIISFSEIGMRVNIS